MMLNLTGLDELETLTKSEGKPLELAISDIIEDPDQPRKFFSEEYINSLAASIKERGVKSPISVKPKNAEGKYIINHGARRYRACLLAGKQSIPAFIDEMHDDYDQAAENIQRENLTPMEIALFIHKRLTAGDKKGDIATKLGQKPSYISVYLPLIDAPPFIQEMARTGKVGGKTLYLLANAYKEHPIEIKSYATSAEEITRAGIAAITERAKKPNLNTLLEVANNVNSIDTDTDSPQTLSNSEVIASPLDTLEKEKSPKQASQYLPVKNETGKKMILLKIGSRIATLTMTGKVQVSYKDTGEWAEIELADVEVIGTEEV